MERSLDWIYRTTRGCGVQERCIVLLRTRGLQMWLQKVNGQWFYEVTKFIKYPSASKSRTLIESKCRGVVGLVVQPNLNESHKWSNIKQWSSSGYFVRSVTMASQWKWKLKCRELVSGNWIPVNDLWGSIDNIIKKCVKSPWLSIFLALMQLPLFLSVWVSPMIIASKSIGR